MLKEALTKFKMILGKDDLDMLMTIQNLTETYTQQEKLPEAEKMLEGMLAIWGEEFPESFRVMSNLVDIYQKRGEMKKAAEMQKNVSMK